MNLPPIIYEGDSVKFYTVQELLQKLKNNPNSKMPIVCKTEEERDYLLGLFLMVGITPGDRIQRWNGDYREEGVHNKYYTFDFGSAYFEWLRLTIETNQY
ncbi:hypothetical protein PP742_gp04 [Alcaligenes phage vB_Af_QDWS595]|uniref:Uncharacterized protein n=1 Tax=Alcaligenes phage vB_Af_QDWS595 TaxID=2877946 RepID=A0AAE8Y1F0_9CAUD|nr:hypothetical protein PP742_gp04 [Alcaligenes phage vB_Af_QDWS595]UCR75562.1 hypothetical protein vBAfaPQDWS595_04 [Alcaligenes phage vB_Af_QDWS595]